MLLELVIVMGSSIPLYIIAMSVTASMVIEGQTLETVCEVQLKDLLSNNLHMNEVQFLDSVRNQYLVLPYPPFGQDKILEERKYYKQDIKNNTLMINFGLQLEYLNHFMFNGKESFR